MSHTGNALPFEARERRARVGQRVDADAVPRHAVAAGDADQAEDDDDRDARRLEAGQPEVGDHHGADEQLEDQQELALLNQVGLAGLVDDRRDVGHRLVDRQVLHRRVGPEAEQQPQHADDQAREQDLVAGHAEEVALVEIGQLDVDLAARAVDRVLGLGLHRRLRRQQRRRHQHRQRKDQRPLVE